MDRRYVPPILLSMLVGLLWLAQAASLLPPTSELADFLVERLKEAGPWAIIVVACVENIVGVNSYFPGAIPLLMLAATASSINEITKIIALIFCGQLIGLSMSFILGAFFKSSGTSRRPVGFQILLALPLFAHPQSAAAAAFLWGGTYRWTSLLIVAGLCIVWSLFWGGFIYFGGSFVIREVGWDYVTLSVCIGWILWIFVGNIRNRRNNSKSIGGFRN